MQEQEKDRPNIDAIMQEIREEILAQRAGHDEIQLALKGKALPSDFYDHLYMAGTMYDQIMVDPYVTESNIPLLGSLVNWFRARMHELVIFYTNRALKQQIAINRHLVEAINLLAAEIEKRDQADGTN